MKVYFMLSRNNFVAVICAVLLFFMLCGQFKTLLLPEVFDGATNESRVNYILSLGYKADETPLSVKETVVPTEYGQSYADYLLLQSKWGFALEDYEGQSVQIYEYECEEGERVTLIVAQDKIIGGHILSKTAEEIKPLYLKGK